MNPFAAHRWLLGGDDTTARHLHKRTAVLARQQTERSQRFHVEPASRYNSYARLKCADGKLQIRAEDPVADTSVKTAAPQQCLGANDNTLL
jgi:hypothetical protein